MKAATLLFFLAFAFSKGHAQQPTANNYTMSPQQYVANQYITIPANAFSGSAAAGTYLSYFVLPNFPTNTVRLQVSPETGGTTTYTAPGTAATASTTPFPSGGLLLGVTPQGRPRATLRVQPTFPTSSPDTVQLNYALYATNNNGVGSYLSATACIFIPIFTTPLDVSLVRFSGEARGAATSLVWTTESEDGLSGFEVEWSTALDRWSTVAAIPSRGNGGDYQWQHETPAEGVNYYRIRCISRDGTFSYSPVVRIDHNGYGATIVAAPNPTRDLLRIEAPEGSVAQLMDLGGKEVGRIQVSINSTMNVQNLASGMYLLTVRSATGGVLAKERIVVKR